MSKNILISLCLFALFIYPSRNSFGQKKNPSEKIKLFNGQNLDGWYTFLQHSGKNHDPKNVFTVENGMIRISGEEWGCITTNEEYENYRLVTEFKWGEKTFEHPG